MPSSEDHLRRAQETRDLAAITKDAWEREALLRMAAQWEELADCKLKKQKGGPRKIQTEIRPSAKLPIWLS